VKHLGTQPLQTERLLLRPFTPADAPAMYANWASDPEVTKYLTWPTHTCVDVSRMVLADWVPRSPSRTGTSGPSCPWT
jgi:ribosomal-protein-alanine N-acetyltransferase